MYPYAVCLLSTASVSYDLSTISEIMYLFVLYTKPGGDHICGHNEYYADAFHNQRWLHNYENEVLFAYFTLLESTKYSPNVSRCMP